MKILTFVCVYFFFSSPDIFADYVDFGQVQLYGRITYIDQNGVILKENCNGNTRKFNWKNNIIVRLNPDCTKTFSMPRIPLIEDRPCAKRKVFKFLIKAKHAISYADVFKYSNGFIHIVYSHNMGTLDIKVNNLDQLISFVSYTNMCESELPESFEVLQ